MENKLNSNLDFFELTNNGKVIASEEKIKSEFIKKYTIIALIPFTIYKIIIYIFSNEGYKKIADYQFILAHIVNNSEATIELMSKIFTCSIAFILSNFFVVIISSIWVFKKQKMKKEYINKIMKIVIIFQVIFTILFSFECIVNYINNSWIYENKFELLSENKGTSNINYNIKEYSNKLENIRTMHLIVELIVIVGTTISCTFLQKKILKMNSV